VLDFFGSEALVLMAKTFFPPQRHQDTKKNIYKALCLGAFVANNFWIAIVWVGLIVYKGKNNNPIFQTTNKTKSPSPVKPKRGIVVAIVPFPCKQGKGCWL
jgi:hypothetical protein